MPALKTLSVLVAMTAWAHSAHGQAIPAELAAMTGTLWSKLEDDLVAGPDATPAQRDAIAQTRQAIVDMRVRYFAKKPPRGVGLGKKLAETLGLDFEDQSDKKQLLALFDMPLPKAEALLSSQFDGEARTNAITALRAARTLNAETSSWSQTTQDDDQITIDWNPDTGKFSISLFDDTKEARFQSSINATVSVSVDPETGDLVTSLTPDDVPLDVLTETEFVEIERNIWGEWTDNDGVVWLFAPLDPSEADSGEVEATSVELRAERAELQNKKVQINAQKEFIWFDPTTDTVLRQDRFRRLGEPWEFRGEKPLVADAEGEIAKIEERIAKIDALLSGNDMLPVEREDPVEFERSNEAGAVAVKIVTTLTDGWSYDWPEANFDGKTIRGRRTKTDVRDSFNSDLPPVIVAELISSWSPPEWLDVSAKIEPGTRKLTLEGGHWGLHVTYKSGMFNDQPSVSGTHTPFSFPKVMTRDSTLQTDYETAWGAADTDLP